MVWSLLANSIHSTPREITHDIGVDDEKADRTDLDVSRRSVDSTDSCTSFSSSTSSSPATTTTRAKKQIQFLDRVLVQAIPGRDSFLPEDKTTMWYTSHEYAEMKEKMLDDLELFMECGGDQDLEEVNDNNNDDAENDTTRQHCFEGLFTHDDFLFRDEATAQSLCAVLSEQQLQWDEDEIDPEWIARVYLELDIVHESTLRARDRAIRLASQVRPEPSLPSLSQERSKEDPYHTQELYSAPKRSIHQVLVV